MSLERVLTRLSENLPDWLSNGLNESQTSQVIILPLLQALGYDIWNPYEVVAEEHSGGGSGAYRSDFTIKLETKAVFIVEVKALNRDFDNNHVAQAVGYVNRLGLRWAILTNGRAWKFFDNSIQKPAPEKLALTVDISDGRARRYLAKLLARDIWERLDAEDKLAQSVAEIDDDIKKRLSLGKIENKLRQELQEGFAATPKGLAKAIDLTLEPNERELAEEEFAELERRLVHGSMESVEKQQDAQALPRTAKDDSRDEVKIVDAIRQGVETTMINRKRSQYAKERLEVYLAGHALDVKSWRDLNAGLAEALLILDHREFLVMRKLLYTSTNERRKQDGTPYPPHEYRELSSGEFLFILGNTLCQKRRVNQMLDEIKAPSAILQVTSQDETLKLP